jgi:hemoglobin-like flavoprotein
MLPTQTPLQDILLNRAANRARDQQRRVRRQVITYIIQALALVVLALAILRITHKHHTQTLKQMATPHERAGE